MFGSRVLWLLLGGVCFAAHFIATAASPAPACEKCNAILAQGITNKFKVTTTEEFKAKLKRELDLTRKEIEKRAAQGGGELEFFDLFKLGGKGAEERYWRLHAGYHETGTLALESGVFYDCCAELVEPAVVNAWKEATVKCLDSERRTKGSLVGDTQGLFIASVRYTPQSLEDPKSIRVSGITPVGARVRGSMMEDVTTIPAYGSISIAFERDGMHPGAIVISFDGASPVEFELPGIDPPVADPPPALSKEDLARALKSLEEEELKATLARNLLRIRVDSFRVYAFDKDNEEDVRVSFVIRVGETEHGLWDESNVNRETGVWHNLGAELTVENPLPGQVSVLGNIGSCDYHRPDYGTDARTIDLAVLNSGQVNLRGESNGGRWEARFSIERIPK